MKIGKIVEINSHSYSNSISCAYKLNIYVKLYNQLDSRRQYQYIYKFGVHSCIPSQEIDLITMPNTSKAIYTVA